MTKKKDEIIEAFVDLGYTKKATRMFLEDFVDVVTGMLCDGHNVQLHGFGTFYLCEVGNRDYINVSTGERAHLDSKKAAKFAPGMTLKNALIASGLH